MRKRATLLALSIALLTPAAAAAVPLNGNPLNVHVGPEGQLQAFRVGTPAGIFYEQTSEIGDAGFFLALAPGSMGQQVWGFEGSAVGPSGINPFASDGQDPVTGTGTASDPLTQVTVYGAAPHLMIRQTTTYVNGAQQFNVRWDVSNPAGGGAIPFKALAAADFFFDGSDRGTGIYTLGPPQFIGGTNADTGNSGGFQEVAGSPWSAYQALAFPDVWDVIEDSADFTGPSFNNTVVADPVDNAGGVEWDQYVTDPLGDNETATFELVVRSAVPSALQLTPPNAGAPKGVPIEFTATAIDTAGTPYAGRTLRWAIAGANPASGSTTLDAVGVGKVVDVGTNAGADTVTVYVDFNNNGTREPAEPQASALATFVDSVAPTCKVKVTGDRPGGGGAGKPLVISVNCDEQATVTVATTLRPLGQASQRRRRPRPIKLKRKTATVQPGQALPVRIKVPKKIARKYAGRRLRATLKVTATDIAGNKKTATVKRTIKLKKIKKKRRRG